MSALALLPLLLLSVEGPPPRPNTVPPTTVRIPSGSLELGAELWRPVGDGPFPAVLFNHGSGPGLDTPLGRRDQRHRRLQAGLLGPVFAKHGYVFLYLFRRGTGASVGQGTYSGDVLDAELDARGPAARNRAQVRLLETDEMTDALAGLAFLRAVPGVDPKRVAVAGHSSGGALALLMAERDRTLRAVVDFAGAAASWDESPPLQTRLVKAARRIAVPVLFVHAANDYTLAPSKVMADEMARKGRQQSLKVYPAVGRSREEGHNLAYLGIRVWEADVFRFLDEHTGPPR